MLAHPVGRCRLAFPNKTNAKSARQQMRDITQSACEVKWALSNDLVRKRGLRLDRERKLLTDRPADISGPLCNLYIINRLDFVVSRRRWTAPNADLIIMASAQQSTGHVDGLQGHVAKLQEEEFLLDKAAAIRANTMKRIPGWMTSWRARLLVWHTCRYLWRQEVDQPLLIYLYYFY